jgi:hypothetical protein
MIVTRQVGAIMAIDVAGYIRMAGEDERLPRNASDLEARILRTNRTWIGHSLGGGCR